MQGGRLGGIHPTSCKSRSAEAFWNGFLLYVVKGEAWQARARLDSRLGLGPTTLANEDSDPGQGILHGRYQFPQ